MEGSIREINPDQEEKLNKEVNAFIDALDYYPIFSCVNYYEAWDGRLWAECRIGGSEEVHIIYTVFWNESAGRADINSFEEYEEDLELNLESILKILIEQEILGGRP